jgi:GNAT superfamily N-acetyltransferase
MDRQGGGDGLRIEQIDLTSERDVQRFMDFPYSLYAGHPLWIPPIRTDTRAQLDPDQHPFYEHSEAEFFLARRGDELVGRIALLENKAYNDYQNLKQAQFYLFESVEDFEVTQALFEHAFEWARKRGLDQIVGPKGFSVFDGYGMLIEGFEFRPMMTMMNYNPPFYPDYLERLGFEKEVDFVSCYIPVDKFQIDERIHRIAERAAKRSGLEVKQFGSKGEMLEWVDRIGETYNRTFVDNWEYYPLTQREVKFVTDNLMTVADPRLIKIIVKGEEVVGFLFAFHDVSSAIQRSGGRLFPFGVPDLLLEMQRTEWISLNGAGILPEYQGLGGNALLYSEIDKTIRSDFARFRHADLTQVAESAKQMRRDLVNLGGVPYKNHRVFIRNL